MLQLRSHGISRDPKDWKQEKQDAWYYEMLDLGFNYRLTDIQAALGLSQMTKLSQNIKKRNILALNYEKLLDKDKLLLPSINKATNSSYHLYMCRFEINLVGQQFSKNSAIRE